MTQYDYYTERNKVQAGGNLPKDVNDFIRRHYADLPLVITALDIAEKSLNSGGSIKVIRKGARDVSQNPAAQVLASVLLKLDDIPTSYGMVSHIDNYEVLEDDKCVVIISKRVINRSVKFSKRGKYESAS
jgi:hypothetical protein